MNTRLLGRNLINIFCQIKMKVIQISILKILANMITNIQKRSGMEYF